MTTQELFDFNVYQRAFPNDGELPRNRDSKVWHLLADHRIVPRLVCADGFSMSVQASKYHYCTPLLTGEPHYSHVEVGFPSEKQEELMAWAESAERPTETVYAWVPVEVVNAVVTKHGGLSK